VVVAVPVGVGVDGTGVEVPGVPVAAVGVAVSAQVTATPQTENVRFDVVGAGMPGVGEQPGEGEQPGWPGPWVLTMVTSLGVPATPLAFVTVTTGATGAPAAVDSVGVPAVALVLVAVTVIGTGAPVLWLGPQL